MMGAGIGALTSVAFIQYLGATDQSRVGLGSMIYTRAISSRSYQLDMAASTWVTSTPESDGLPYSPPASQ
jgi:hypothetical protein